MTPPLTGYILTSRSYDKAGENILSFWLKTGAGPKEILVGPNEPVFFISRDTSKEPAKQLGYNKRREVELTDFNGNPVDAVYFKTQNQYFNGKNAARDVGIRVYESDVRPEERYLMERFIHRTAEVLQGGNLKKATYLPLFRTLSIDIETGPDKQLYSLAWHTGEFQMTEGRRAAEQHPDSYQQGEAVSKGYEGVLIIRDRQDESDAEVQSVPWAFVDSEKELLHRFFQVLEKINPDIIIGWNVIGFDLRIIEKKCRDCGVPFRLGRSDREARIFEKTSGFWSIEADGRIVLDGPQVLRSGFFTFENFSLESVATEVLGKGKDIRDDGQNKQDKLDEINRRYREAPDALARYNLEDCRLVTEIFQKTGIIQQFFTRSIQTGLQLDRVSMSVAAFDFFMLPLTHRQGLVAPDVADVYAGQHAAGGHVFTSTPGMYEHVIVLDFRSLYPSIMRTFHIDPVARCRAASVMKETFDGVIKTPVNIMFSREHQVLGDFIAEMLEKRKQAKHDGNEHLSMAIKILLNSFYGVMGTPGCRFYHFDLPTAITGTGQWVLKNTAAFLADLGYRVLYGDTDSVFVQLKEEERGHAAGSALEIVRKVNEYFETRLKEEFMVESFLELEFEKHYAKFLLPPMRGYTESVKIDAGSRGGGVGGQDLQMVSEGSESGARKRYAGLLDGSEEIEFKGLEYVRSDWTKAAREFQYELYRRIFLDLEVEEWIRSFVSNLKDGHFNEDLVYKKRLTKPASKYEKNVPPHVKAVRMLDPEDKRKMRRIEYVITKRGPVPTALPHDDIDYDHYVEKQIKPLADGILFVLHVTFDEIIGGRQFDLFGP